MLEWNRRDIHGHHQDTTGNSWFYDCSVSCLLHHAVPIARSTLYYSSCSPLLWVLSLLLHLGSSHCLWSLRRGSRGHALPYPKLTRVIDTGLLQVKNGANPSFHFLVWIHLYPLRGVSTVYGRLYGSVASKPWRKKRCWDSIARFVRILDLVMPWRVIRSHRITESIAEDMV